MKSTTVCKLRNYGSSTSVALILAATAGCARPARSLPAGGPTPSDLGDLVRTDLDTGQKTMATRGYVIVNSSFFAKEQYWLNKGSQTCVSVKIDGTHIASLSTINTAECTKRIASARKVWEGCHDGPSLTHSPGLDRERDKLPSQGYNATYWVKDASPGRSMEYWSSGNGNNCMGLVFETSGGTFVKTANSEPKQCVNPAPIK